MLAKFFNLISRWPCYYTLQKPCPFRGRGPSQHTTAKLQPLDLSSSHTGDGVLSPDVAVGPSCSGDDTRPLAFWISSFSSTDAIILSKNLARSSEGHPVSIRLQNSSLWISLPRMQEMACFHLMLPLDPLARGMTPGQLGPSSVHRNRT